MMLRKESVQASLFGFFMWGSWAFYINLSLSTNTNQAITSGVAQALSSGTLGYLMTEAIAFSYKVLCARQLSANNIRAYMYSILTGAVATSFYVAHSIVGTENILATSGPPFCMAFLWIIWCTELRLKEQ